jgi:hypothetical protein
MRKLLLASAATFGALLATAGGAKAQPLKPVAAGTVVVHLNGYLQFEVGAFGSSDNTVGAAKLNSVGTDGDARIYAGIDALTVSGISYGTQIELRTSSSDATNGNNSKTGSGSTTGLEGVYVRRAYGYIGTKEAGYVRLGQTDSAFGLLQTGVIEAYGDGNQFTTTGGVANILPTDASINGSNNFAYADQSNLYATDKVVYLTPAIDEPLLGGAFSGAVGFEPNSNGLAEGYGNCAAASSNNGAASPSLTCASIDASPDSGNISKERKNTIDAALEYVLKANGFASKFSIGILHGAPISYDGAAPLSAKYGYDELNVFQLGGQTTFAGLTVGANIKTGAVEDGYTFKPKGARNALVYSVSGDYVLGPYVVGATFIDSQSSGAYVPGSADGHTLGEYGVAVGGNYVIGKDLSLFAQYMYDHRHQYKNAGLNLNEPTKGAAQAQIVAAGATFKW